MAGDAFRSRGENTWQPAGSVVAGQRGGRSLGEPGAEQETAARVWEAEPRRAAQVGMSPSTCPPPGRPSHRCEERGESRGIPAKVLSPAEAADEECPRAPERKGVREGLAWASSYLHLGYCSSPGSQKVSAWARGDWKPLLPALQSWPRAGQPRPGPRSAGSWHGRQEVRGLDSFTCGNLLFSSH